MEAFVQIGLWHFVCVSALLAAAGIATMLTKRNAIGILIGVELMLNGAGLNLVAFNQYLWADGPRGAAMDGLMFAIFIIVLAAAEAAVTLAIFLNFYNNVGTIDVENAQSLRG